MSKTLIIAEKPSVSTDLSRALAKAPRMTSFDKKGKGREYYFENDTHVITSAVGHLIQLKMPTGPNGKNLPWKFDVLPVVPKKFALEPIEQAKGRLNQVLRLARRKDIDTIVNACDAGREGELIFKYILEYGKVDKPVKRLWMRSMTTQAILDAWASLREDEAMKDLTAAAKCRSESDWLVGLNSTRALTCFRSRHGGFNITSTGRVQTPTLAILAKREMEIRSFIPTPYAEVHADFSVDAGYYSGRWIDTEWKKDPSNIHAKAERLWEVTIAQAIKDRCEGKTGSVTETKKPSKQASPQLYDLTTLQREASSRFGYSAGNTLKIAQALYERHKMLTYPRTDSRYLPEDYLATVRNTIDAIGQNYTPLADYAKDIQTNKRLVPTKRVFNNNKISDHFAIIPTGRFDKLSEPEQKIFELVTKRFLAVFFPHAVFEDTRRETTIARVDGISDTFLTTGKVLVEPGWLAVYGRKLGVAAGKDELCPVSEGESANVDAISVKEEETKPPARYNESTLLSAMEGAGKLIDDEALREAMAERGLGTPATRAATIEALIRQKYIARDGREIHVRASGLKLIETLHEIGVTGLTSPSMTGDWESKLRQMEQGKLDPPVFMQEIIEYTKDIVARTKDYANALESKVFPEIKIPCPKCGVETLKQTDSTYECMKPECGFKVTKYIANRLLTEDEARELFTKKSVGPLEGFKSRFNRPFEASLEIDEKFKVVFSRDKEEMEDLTDDMIIGAMTFEDKTLKIYETEKSYYVPEAKNKQAPNGMKISKVILQQPLSKEDAIKMFQGEKSALMENFISNRTKRKFKAFLIYDFKNARPAFDFPPREAKKKTGKKRGQKAAKKKES